MAKSSIRFRLQGGYSHLLDRTRLEVTLEEGPLRGEFKTTPLELFSRPTELVFRIHRSFKASGPGNLRWQLKPGTRIRAVVLQPRNAFLGNFRVPDNQFAVQWDVEGEVTSKASRRQTKLLVSAEAGSTLVHSWVTSFPSATRLAEAVQQSWEAFVDPLDPDQARNLCEGLVIRFRWSGSLRARLGVEWGMIGGWQVDVPKALLELRAAAVAKAALRAELNVSQRGSFILRLSRRRGRVQLSISKGHERSRITRIEVRASLRDRLQVRPRWRTARPLLEPLNDRLAEALARKAEIAFTVESKRWSRRQTLLKATWKKSAEVRLVENYRTLLSGALPRPQPGLKMTGRFENIQRKRLTIALNLLSWLRFGKSSEEEDFYRVEVGPSGEVTVEQGKVMARTRYRWDGLQLVRLLCGRKAIENHARETFLWTFQVQKGFERVELLRLLKKALHLRSIRSFDLPGPNRFPLHLDLRWCSSFSTKGVAMVRKSPAKDRWDAMVAALELAEPTLYRKGSYGRDWMDSRTVRSVIDENPIQSHLQSIYPLARRSTLERKQVVATYLRVKKFLDLMEQWEQGNQGQLRESLDLGWELPIFYWFHLLCPSNQRESVLILTGDLDRVWGEPGVIDN